jgi:hypothetical protein
MSAALVITRPDHTATELRALAARCRDGAQVRRLLALALVMDGHSRSVPARRSSRAATASACAGSGTSVMPAAIPAAAASAARSSTGLLSRRPFACSVAHQPVFRAPRDKADGVERRRRRAELPQPGLRAFDRRQGVVGRRHMLQQPRDDERAADALIPIHPSGVSAVGRRRGPASAQLAANGKIVAA